MSQLFSGKDNLIQPPLEIMLLSGGAPRNGERFLSLGPMWNALVRGWRNDCVVGGMETRFQ